MSGTLRQVKKWVNRDGQARRAAAILGKGYRWLRQRPEMSRRGVHAGMLAHASAPAAPQGVGRERLVDARIGNFEFAVMRGDFTEVATTLNTYEANVLDRLLEDAAKASVVVDVGANVGFIALPTASVMPPHGKLYCFEISQFTAKVLVSNARRNGLDNIIVFPAGASDRFEATLMHVRSATTLNSLSATAGDPLAHDSDLVLSVPLDAIFAGDGGERVDVIKIDTDGYEYRVLKGAMNLLATHKPIVYLEYCPQLAMSVSGVPGEVLLKLLGELGYQPMVLHRGRPPEDIGKRPLDEMIAAVQALWLKDLAAGLTHLDIRWHVPS